jgi:hypothetical protein
MNESIYRTGLDPDDPSVGYDPAAVRRVLRDYANLLSPEEGRRRIEAIYLAREAGSRQANRL